jgi:hypothetical protein
MSADSIFFNVFPKSGTGLLHAVRGITNHVNMFDKNEKFKEPHEYANEVIGVGVCTGHIPYNEEFLREIKREGFRTVFIIRNLSDVVCSLTNYLATHEGSELNVMLDGVRLSRHEDKLSAGIRVVADWWEHFAEWMNAADSIYPYRELRGAALLFGNEDKSSTFLHGTLGQWRREFKQHHILEARRKLPDIIKDYYRSVYE